MPLYVLTTEDGETRTVLRSMKDAPPIGKPVRIDGKVYFRDVHAEHGRPRSAANGYPRVSHAAGIHPSQLREQMAKDRRDGIPTKYDPKANPIFESPGHEKRYLEANGLYHRDCYGGRGDARRLGRMRPID